jgi:NitT/TauT family transport system ATP-binding protein
MDESPPLVGLRGVRKTFAGGTVALDGVDLVVRQGEFLSLLGPSGCGKSTALRLMAGLSTPSAGSVEYGEKPSLGFVFQEPTLMPWRTVAANVRLPLQLQGVGRRQAAPIVGESLARVGLTGFENAYPRQLSGGMKMRASIARALTTKPRLLLMDEPFAALDEITRGRLNDDLLRLWETEGLTIVFVTHSVYESVYLSSRIVVMAPRPGRVAADIPVHAPPGRNEAYRTTEEYARDCRTVSAALRDAMGEAGHRG